jgi:hypothetical protein
MLFKKTSKSSVIKSPFGIVVVIVFLNDFYL